MGIQNVLISDAVREYRDFMEADGLSDRTRRLYAGKCEKFAVIYEGKCAENRHRPYVSFIDVPVVTAFLSAYAMGASRNDALQALRQFLKWAAKSKYITAENALALYDRRRSPVIKGEHRFLEAREFGSMLAIAGERHPRDRAALALGIFTLARCSEICRLTLRDVDLIGGRLSAYRSKVYQEAQLVVVTELREELNGWLSWYADWAGCASPVELIREHPDWFLVPHLTWPPYQGDATVAYRFVKVNTLTATVHPLKQALRLELAVKFALSGLGYEYTNNLRPHERSHKGEGMHLLRRSAARALLKHLTKVYDGDGHRAMRQVSKALGHKSLKTTEIYLGLDVDKSDLDDWMTGTDSMFGDIGMPQGDGKVLSLHGPQIHAEPANPAPTAQPANAATAL